MHITVKVRVVDAAQGSNLQDSFNKLNIPGYKGSSEVYHLKSGKMKVSVSSRVPGPLPSISKIQPRKAEGPGRPVSTLSQIWFRHCPWGT
jgi:hypothetical protein